MIDVVCATLGQRDPIGLEYAGEHRLLVDGSPGWATAVNALLDRSDHDVLHIDDDIELTPHSLSLLASVYDHADVFGFTLFTGGGISSAGFYTQPDGQLVPQRNTLDLFRPGLVAHCTASCLYIKRRVIDAGVRFPVWRGQHYEDVAFTFDCWLRGFRVAYVPGVVHHHMDPVGVGATKAKIDGFNAARAVNHTELWRWIAEHDVAGAIRDGRVPTEWGAVA